MLLSTKRTTWHETAVFFALLLLTDVSLLAQRQNSPTLSLGPVNRQNISMSFYKTEGTLTPGPADADLRDMAQSAPTKSGFTLYADLKQIGPNKFANLFLFTLYAHDGRAAADQAWYRFDVKAQSGNFVDSVESVHFTIERPGTSDDGEIMLPLHSFGDQPLVSLALVESPAPVHLSSGDDIQINVKNLSPTLGLTIAQQAQLILDNPPLWKTQGGFIDLGGRRTLAPGGEATLAIHLIPNNIHALLGTLSPFKQDKSHDVIKAVINCFTDQGGVTKTVPAFSIPVRFEPSFLSLFLAVTVASVLGTILSQLLPGTWKGPRTLLRQVVVSWGIALVVECFAMLLVQLGSKLVLFTFELDPWQVLPAFFIGFFVSGGKQVLDYAGVPKGVGRSGTQPATVRRENTGDNASAANSASVGGSRV